MIKSLTLFPKSMAPEKIEAILSKVVTTQEKEKGLLSIKSSKGDLMSPAGPPSYTRVLESNWESLAAFMAWAQNQSEDDNAVKDFLIEQGAVLLYYEIKDLV